MLRPVAHIANVSSMGGFLPVPGQTISGVSEAAVRLLTEGLYPELLETDVGVIEDDRLHTFVGRDSRLMNLANRLAPRRSTHLIERQMRSLLSSPPAPSAPRIRLSPAGCVPHLRAGQPTTGRSARTPSGPDRRATGRGRWPR